MVARLIWLKIDLGTRFFGHSDAEMERTGAGQERQSREDQNAIDLEALEWLDQAEQAREVAGQLTDAGAKRAVLELADSFDRLARAAATPAVLRRKELAAKDRERS